MTLPNGVELVAIDDANFLQIEGLVDEAKREGFEFVQRTIDEWDSGVNRFSRVGEGLWGVFSGAELVGIGGLNIDPYVKEAGVGRVRHLYVRRDHRRKGCAGLLMQTIIGQAWVHFRLLRLFTANPAAGSFYERLGFERMEVERVSHVMRLDISTCIQ